MKKIFYSGIGDNKSYNPLERPHQINYQYSVGTSQFDKIRDMTLIRKRNSLLLDGIFVNKKKINFLKESGIPFGIVNIIFYIQKIMQTIYMMKCLKKVHICCMRMFGIVQIIIFLLNLILR